MEEGQEKKTHIVSEDFGGGESPKAGGDHPPTYFLHPDRQGSVVDDEIVRTKEIQYNIPILRNLRKAEEWIDSKVGIELRGVDRIPEEEKQPPSKWNMFLFWWSLNIQVGNLPLGVLGPQFGLTFNDTVGASVIGICLGALCTAFTGTLGPKTGLRQIACSRYSFGFWGAKLCSVLNVVIGGGFYVVNLVVVGQILSAVSNYHMSIEVGIVIIAVVSYLISIFGFKLIHTYEKYSWIVGFILLAVLYGQAAPHLRTDLPGIYGPSNTLAYKGSYLSILAINFSLASGWCSISSDYMCNYPNTTSSLRVFVSIWLGVVMPTVYTVVLGAVIGSIAVIDGTPPYAEVFKDHGIGGLVGALYHPDGWSKFCLVILVFSVLGNNIAINYSSGLSLQLLGHYFHAVPRFIWSFIFAIVVAVLAIAGRQSLSAVVSDFVSLLGYWTVSFTVILLIEDKVFRRRTGYDLPAWDQPSKLPLGIAAVFSLLCGYLGGGVPGMSQVWFVGPVAKQFGPAGGDVGVYMSFVITLLVYPPARYIERKYSGR